MLGFMRKPEMEEIREQLALLIARKGYGSVGEIAQEVGITRQHLGKFRNGLDVSNKTLRKIRAVIEHEGSPQAHKARGAIGLPAFQAEGKGLIDYVREAMDPPQRYGGLGLDPMEILAAVREAETIGNPELRKAFLELSEQLEGVRDEINAMRKSFASLKEKLDAAVIDSKYRDKPPEI